MIGQHHAASGTFYGTGTRSSAYAADEPNPTGGTAPSGDDDPEAVRLPSFRQLPLSSPAAPSSVLRPSSHGPSSSSSLSGAANPTPSSYLGGVPSSQPPQYYGAHVQLSDSPPPLVHHGIPPLIHLPNPLLHSAMAFPHPTSSTTSSSASSSSVPWPTHPGFMPFTDLIGATSNLRTYPGLGPMDPAGGDDCVEGCPLPSSSMTSKTGSLQGSTWEPQTKKSTRLMKIVTRLKGLGTVTVIVAAGRPVRDVMTIIESHAWHLYGLSVEVQKLSDIHGVDLVPSYEVGKLLESDVGQNQSSSENDSDGETHVVDALYRQVGGDLDAADRESASQRSAIDRLNRAPARSSNLFSCTTSISASTSALVPASSSSSSSSSTSSRHSVHLAFVESPPTTVLQNKEFSFTIGFTFPAGEAWPEEAAVKMLRVFAASESGELVPHQNFSIRMLALKEHDKDLVGIFMRLRVNSYYGRKRYVIRVVSSDPDWKSNTITSEPITVLSKKIHRPSKKKSRAETEGAESISTSSHVLNKDTDPDGHAKRS